MIEQEVEVLAVTEQALHLSKATESACSSCKQTCAGSFVSRASSITDITIPSDQCSIQVAPGDRLVLGIDESNLVKSAFSIYLIPLVSLFVGAIAGAEAVSAIGFNHDFGSLLGGMLGLLSSFLYLRRIRGKSDTLNPIILRKIS
jgi:sigma-E factor negative regulatory protein RseC